jgi:hypothetical protein
MRVTTGRVVNGKIEVPDEELAEGMVVTILAKPSNPSKNRATKTSNLFLPGLLEWVGMLRASPIGASGFGSHEGSSWQALARQS